MRTLVVLLPLMLASCCSAQLRDVPVYPLTAAVEFTSGGWSEIEPREGPKVLKRSFPQIVIFAKVGDEKVFRLAKQVDKLVSEKAWGKWCALVICHQNDPTPSKEQWNRMQAELRTQSATHQLDSISVGLWKRLPESLGAIRTHRRFDGFDDHEVVIIYRNMNHVTQYLERLETGGLNPQTLERVSRQLEGLIDASTATGNETSK